MTNTKIYGKSYDNFKDLFFNNGIWFMKLSYFGNKRFFRTFTS